jgi:hypothetical protein
MFIVTSQSRGFRNGAQWDYVLLGGGGFCILLRVLYQGYRKNRPSQQLFNVFIYIYFTATCFGPRWPSSGGIHNIFGKLPHYNGSVVLCYRSYFVYGLADTAVVYLICGNVN